MPDATRNAFISSSHSVTAAATVLSSIGFAALLFGSLLFGTTHGLQSGVSSIDPQLAGNLTYIIQGLIVLFVGADVLILYVWNARKKLRPKRKAPASSPAEAAT